MLLLLERRFKKFNSLLNLLRSHVNLAYSFKSFKLRSFDNYCSCNRLPKSFENFFVSFKYLESIVFINSKLFQIADQIGFLNSLAILHIFGFVTIGSTNFLKNLLKLVLLYELSGILERILSANFSSSLLPNSLLPPFNLRV